MPQHQPAPDGVAEKHGCSKTSWYMKNRSRRYCNVALLSNIRPRYSAATTCRLRQNLHCRFPHWTHFLTSDSRQLTTCGMKQALFHLHLLQPNAAYALFSTKNAQHSCFFLNSASRAWFGKVCQIVTCLVKCQRTLRNKRQSCGLQIVRKTQQLPSNVTAH